MGNADLQWEGGDSSFLEHCLLRQLPCRCWLQRERGSLMAPGASSCPQLQLAAFIPFSLKPSTKSQLPLTPLKSVCA